MIEFSKEIRSSKILPYIMVGEHSIERSIEQFDYYVQKGCQVIEIGVPFSDPSADGITIQAAAERAIENKITIDECLEFSKACKERAPQVKLILMSYLNPIYAYGLDAIFKTSSIDGVIIPDLPYEEYDLLADTLDKSHIGFIPLIGLDTPEERIREIISLGSGFIYLMSVKGITGSKTAQENAIAQSVRRIRKASNLPIVAGFGIRTRPQANQILTHTDGVIIASEFIRLWNQGNYNVLDNFFPLRAHNKINELDTHLKSTLWIP